MVLFAAAVIIAAELPGQRAFAQLTDERRQIGQLLDAAAQKYGIPPDILKALAYQESTWSNILGRDKHGKGVLQIDDRYYPFARTTNVWDPAKNIDYGARLLAKNFARYGSWDTAVMRYNGSNATARRNADRVMRHVATKPWLRWYPSFQSTPLASRTGAGTRNSLAQNQPGDSARMRLNPNLPKLAPGASGSLSSAQAPLKTSPSGVSTARSSSFATGQRAATTQPRTLRSTSTQRSSTMHRPPVRSSGLRGGGAKRSKPPARSYRR